MTFDVGIVLGHFYSPLGFSSRQKKRMNKALELQKKGKIKFIITTGGKGKLFNLTQEPLGKVAREYLINNGVKENRVIEENRSTNTQENAKFSLTVMRKNDFNSALVITSIDHINRAKRIFNDVFPDDIELDYVISDYFSGLWSIWDFMWQTAGWFKYLVQKNFGNQKT